MLIVLYILLSIVIHAPAIDQGQCNTTKDCSLNGDCINGKCKCDPAWSSSPVCDIISFESVSKADTHGVYNATETTWGGYPIQDDSGKWHLFHAQMLNSCGLGTWTHNSIVARSVADKVNGPYTFAQEVYPSFAHNPTIRKTNDGVYVIYFIGGWATVPVNCSKQKIHHSTKVKHIMRSNTCVEGAKVDNATLIRVGGDYRNVLLAPESSVEDCITTCCNDINCEAFSFNKPATSTDDAPGCPQSKGHSCCKLKNKKPPTQPSGCPICLTGTIPARIKCNKDNWPKECGPNMPGPSGDTCGADPLNKGCGIATLHSKSLEGPWTYSPLNITNQWLSILMDCAHTNPAPVFLSNGTVIIAFNAGYCHNHLETIGIAIAPHWSGPYTLLSLVPILGNPINPHHSEDPFLWKSKRGWHLLSHNMQGPQGVSSYAFSEDAIHWTLSTNTPYNCTVHYPDGTHDTVSGCGNRPQIVFDKLGHPLWLINGANRARLEENNADAFTLFRKFKTSQH